MISPGDSVIIGAPRRDSVHWVVVSVSQADESHRYATLRSPFSSYTRVVPLERLTLHAEVVARG